MLEAAPALTEADAQSVAAPEASVIEVHETRSDNYSGILMQTERIHQQ